MAPLYAELAAAERTLETAGVPGTADAPLAAALTHATAVAARYTAILLRYAEGRPLGSLAADAGIATAIRHTNAHKLLRGHTIQKAPICRPVRQKIPGTSIAFTGTGCGIGRRCDASRFGKGAGG